MIRSDRRMLGDGSVKTYIRVTEGYSLDSHPVITMIAA